MVRRAAEHKKVGDFQQTISWAAPSKNSKRKNCFSSLVRSSVPYRGQVTVEALCRVIVFSTFLMVPNIDDSGNRTHNNSFVGMDRPAAYEGQASFMVYKAGLCPFQQSSTTYSNSGPGYAVCESRLGRWLPHHDSDTSFEGRGIYIYVGELCLNLVRQQQKEVNKS